MDNDGLAVQHEDMSSDPQNPYGKAGVAARICNLSAGGWGGTGQLQGAP